MILKKLGDEYKLYSHDSCIATTHESPYKKLSLKNCEAIANGYDLDELANRAFHYMGYHSTVTPHEEKQFKLGYNIAFREALEILGDKKFSEKQMYEFADYSWKYSPRTHPEYDENLIKQKTEWEVTFNPDEKDSEGCLILKRK